MDYYKQDGDKLVCLLCGHYCKLKEGQAGICGVNARRGDKVKNLVYGKVAAINIDPIEKKPLYHFLPASTSLSIGTVGCNFKCPFCQNWGISQTHDFSRSREASPQALVNAALQRGCQSISYTYNEPTIFYPYAKDTALLAREHGINNVFVSNGFESKEVVRDMRGVIDACNIDLKSFNAPYYKKELKGGLQKVLDTLVGLKEQGILVEVTTLLVPGSNDSEGELKEIASFIANEMDPSTPWHISAFHPDYKMTEGIERTSMASLQKAFKIGEDAGLKYIYIGNTTIDKHTYCPDCHTSVIKRNGFRVLENNLVDGKCPKCSREIEGVWS
jgi:pyruvate formate lyase activating enzyme